MKTQLASFTNKAINKAKYASAFMTCAIASAMTNPTVTFADGAEQGASGPGALVGKILDVVVNILPFVGGFFVIAGVFKLVLAYRNDQPEAQAGAARDIVIGAVLLVFRIFVWNNIKGAIPGLT